MTTTLRFLKSGTLFRLPSLGICGRLLSVNECRARVRIGEAEEKVVRFTDRWGDEHEFVRRAVRETSWSPNVVVEIDGCSASGRACVAADRSSVPSSSKRGCDGTTPHFSTEGNHASPVETRK